MTIPTKTTFKNASSSKYILPKAVFRKKYEA